MAKRLFSGLLLLIVMSACGSTNPSATPSSPSQTTSTGSTQSTDRWTLNSDSSSSHIAMFKAQDGSTLDLWQEPSDGSAVVRIQQANGNVAAVGLDSAGRLTYLADPSGNQAWVTSYGSDGTADISVLTKSGRHWRGTVDASELGTTSLRTGIHNSLRPQSLLPNLSQNLVVIGQWFCNSTIVMLIESLDTEMCFYEALTATAVTEGAAGETIVGCFADAVVSGAIQQGVCHFVDQAAQKVANMTSASLPVTTNPRTTPPSIPVSSSPYDGSWNGSGSGTSSLSTAATVQLSFSISGGRFTTISFPWRINTPAGTTASSYCGSDGAAGTFAPLYISNGSFSFEQDPAPGATGLQYRILLNGSFSSTTRASGTIQFQRVSTDGPTYCGSATIPWNATR